MAELTPEDIILKNKISERIKTLREGTGLTQIDFAKKHDIDRQHINRWENPNNKRGVTVYTVKKFCQMLGISLKEFFDSKLFE